jgi:hypothetical protein
MTKCRLALSLFALLWCCSSSAQMTNNYRDAVTTALAPSFSSCGTAVPVSACWATAVSGTPTLSALSVGVDQETWGIASGTTNILRYNQTSQSWDSVLGLAGAIQLAVVDSGNVFALAACASGDPGCNKIYKYNGNGTWTNISSSLWFTQLAVGSDNDLWALSNTAYGCGKKVYHYNTSTSTFDFMNVGASQISVHHKDDVYTVCASVPTNNISWYYGGVWLTVNGWMSSVTVLPDGSVWGIGASGVLYHLNSTGAWDGITGKPTLIAGANQSEMYGLFAGVVKKYASTIVTVNYNVSGSATCSSGCGSNVNHTGTATLTVTGHAMVTNQQSVPFANYLTVTSSVSLTPMESEGCVYGEQGVAVISAGCPQSNTSGRVTCPMMGSVFTGILPSSFPYVERAFTFRRRVGTPFNCRASQPTGQVTNCDNNVANWCTSATTPPDFNDPGPIRDMHLPVDISGWLSSATCVGHIDSSGVHGPWACIQIPVIENDAREYDDIHSAPPYVCTHNP